MLEPTQELLDTAAYHFVHRWQVMRQYPASYDDMCLRYLFSGWQADRAFSDPAWRERTCRVCNERYAMKNHMNLYCSPACGRQWAKSRPNYGTRVCEHCNCRIKPKKRNIKWRRPPYPFKESYVLCDACLSQIKERRRTGIPKGMRDKVLAKTNGCCFYCGVVLVPEPASNQFWVDHVIPVVEGGETVLKNLVPACRSCNIRKHARSAREWLLHIEVHGPPVHAAPESPAAHKASMKQLRRMVDEYERTHKVGRETAVWECVLSPNRPLPVMSVTD